MKFAPLIILLGLLIGCARDDVRLHGTWRSNRDATVAAAFQRNPNLTNLPPERLERFKDVFGHLAMTYSNGMATTVFRGKNEGTFRYRVVVKASDFVVIRSDSPWEKDQDFKIRFVDGGRAYWIDATAKIDERFDRVEGQ